MSTQPIPLPQFGAQIKAKHPEYGDMSDADVGAKVLAKYPQYSDMVDPKTVPGAKLSLVQPAGSAFPLPTDGTQSGAADIISSSPQDYRDVATSDANRVFANNPGAGKPGGHQEIVGDTDPIRRALHVQGIDETLERTAKNAGRRTARSLVQAAAHPVDTAVAAGKGLISMLPQDPDLPMTVTGDGSDNSLVQQAQGYVDTARQSGLSQAVSDAGGDALTGVILGKGVSAVTPVLADTAATGLNVAGRALKATGAGASRVAVGAPAAADAMGADAGAALSRNRIVGLTKRSLARKVGDTVGPASEARDSILQRSEAAPTDVQPLTQAPFDDISEAKTGPQTGAVQPGSMARMNTTRRAIQNVQDPETGAVTQTPKDLNLSPAQMGKLQSNVYDMTDYQSPESTLSNQYTKSVGARLKGAINAAAPEAQTATDNIHDLLGAQEHLKSTTPAPLAATDLGLGKMAGHAYDAARVGGGTALGAGLDFAGTIAMKAGGALRRVISDSPVAPVAAPTPGARPQGMLEANTPTDAQTVGPEDLDKGGPDGFQRSPSAQTPPAPPQRRALTAQAGPDATSDGSPVGNLHPGTPGPGARTRITPSPVAPHGQQVLEDQPGFVNPRGTRTLIAAPDGTVTPEPYPLGPGTQPLGALESRTGPRAPSARPSLLRNLRREAGTAGVANAMDSEMGIRASQEKLAGVPEATGIPEQPAAEARAQVPPPAPVEAAPTRLPDPADIDGWEALVDKGYARYNTSTHQYDYTGPVRRKLTR